MWDAAVNGFNAGASGGIVIGLIAAVVVIGGNWLYFEYKKRYGGRARDEDQH
jgi:hypothetical protein